MIDAFRLINPNMMVLGQEPRQTTSNLGHLQKPSVQVSKILIAIIFMFLQTLYNIINKYTLILGFNSWS